MRIENMSCKNICMKYKAKKNGILSLYGNDQKMSYLRYFSDVESLYVLVMSTNCRQNPENRSLRQNLFLK